VPNTRNDVRPVFGSMMEYDGKTNVAVVHAVTRPVVCELQAEHACSSGQQEVEEITCCPNMHSEWIGTVEEAEKLILDQTRWGHEVSSS
jgi:hypothetical protein